MHTFDPREWRGWQGPRDDQPIDPNSEHLLRWGLFVALSVCLASFGPPELMPAVLSSLFHIGALAAALVAIWKQEPVDAPHLTRWDEAAASMALSLLLEILFPTAWIAASDVDAVVSGAPPSGA